MVACRAGESEAIRFMMQPHANLKRVEDQHELRGHVVITKLKDRRKREQTLE